MKIDEAVSILRAHNEWRRAPAHLPEDARPAMGHPRKIGIAIDTVCDALSNSRLIAAAPDLLEALEKMKASFEDLLNGYPERELHEPYQVTLNRASELLEDLR